MRVTNLANQRSIVVRVNDRGPYVGDRVIDLSVRTAKLLGFHGHGLAKVKVDYVGRAPLAGSDDRKLASTLREGVPGSAPPVQVASNKEFAPAYFDNRPMTQVSSQVPARVPAPADRPYRLGEGAHELPAVAAPARPQTRTTELAAATRSRPAEISAQALRPAVESAVSPVSAYAPTRYDSGAGFMSGRGLY